MIRYDKHKYPSVHRGIVRAALILLELEQHPAAKRYSAGDAEVLIGEADAPDRRGDRQRGRGLHYYCAAKPDGTALPLHPALGGYCNGRVAPAPSPLTVLDAEYRTALALYGAGRFIPAMQSLSRAMHMLADICCPPHTAGLTYFSRYAGAHKRYEARAAELFWDSDPAALIEYHAAKSWAEKAAGSVPFSAYTDLLRGSVPESSGTWRTGKFAELCSRLAHSGTKELSAVLGDDAIALDQSIERRLKLSVAHCAALLAAFDRDADDPELPVWKEQQPYWLKSFMSAFTVTKEPLFLEFEDDGTVTLSTQEKRYLAVGSMGRVLLTEQTEGYTCRFRFGREPLLTLYPDGDQDRLLAQIRGQLFCIRRMTHLQGDLFLSQTSFALVTRQPEKAKVLLT